MEGEAKLLASLNEYEKQGIISRTHIAIFMSLRDKFLHEVLKEKNGWWIVVEAQKHVYDQDASKPVISKAIPLYVEDATKDIDNRTPWWI